jgi:ABC-type phosphate transport system substrate-binding protein
MNTFILTPIAFADDINIIANPNLSIDSLSKHELKNIYLGKKTRWNDGDRIIFVIYESGDVHEKFLKMYIGKSVSQFNNYWKRIVFTGKGKFPRKFNNENELLTFIDETPNAIGYVGNNTVLDIARVLSVN